MLADEEDVSISTREPSDNFEPFGQSELEVQIGKELVKRLGQSTIIASKVNGSNGLWVGFQIEKDNYWLLMDPDRLNTVSGSTWLVWLLTASALSLAGAALIARLINRPLRQLSIAASRVRDGNFTASPLDEHVITSEIREVNIGFNRMAERLAKLEQERALMLAGISHDLRTPLARLRLETELSVSDEQARAYMAADIEQLDAIIDKFLDYARPGNLKMEPVLLSQIISGCVAPFLKRENFEVHIDVASDLEEQSMTSGASQPSAARSGSCWYSTPWMVSLLHRCT
jgi:two-component system osmolarity sensor histidine kinase EnvZ